MLNFAQFWGNTEPDDAVKVNMTFVLFGLATLTHKSFGLMCRLFVANVTNNNFYSNTSTAHYSVFFCVYSL